MGKISYLDLAIANETIKTTDIKGKEYAEVNQRIKAFRMVYPKGIINTQMVSNENGICIFKAIVCDEQGNILGTGTAYEKEDSSFINKTSYIENCETSAVGRALGMAGFGIDVSVASAEEVANAINNQMNIEVSEEEAKSYKLGFGKYKDKTLEEIIKEDNQYVQWLLNNHSNPQLVKCYEVLTGEKLPTEEEQDERIKDISKINELALETDTDIEDIHKHFKVDSISQMTTKQMNECIKILEKKIFKKIVSEE